MYGAIGPMLIEAVRAAKILREQGIKIAVINMASVVPIDRQAVIDASRSGCIITAEDHSVYSGLGSLVSQEAREQTCSRADQARAAVAQAEVAVDSARLNLARAEIRAPSSGTITNFDLRQGAYATAGHPVLALVDAQSLYVEGYFEETKLPRIHVGDPVEIQPMGASHALRGHVESFSAGIADRDRSTSANLLPSVNPSFNWVRLPQRVPVRVKLDPLPPGERLVAGQTVTVQVLRVNVEERELDFHLIPAPVEERPATARPQRRKPAPTKRKKPAARKGRPRRRRRR